MEGPFVSEEKLNGNSNLVEIFGKGSRDLEAQSSYHRETEPLLAQRDMIVNIHLELTQGVCGRQAKLSRARSRLYQRRFWRSRRHC